jgi:hypothetical protein
LDHFFKKGTMQLLTRDPLIIVSRAAHQAKDVVVVEARTQSGLRTACFTTVKPTITHGVAPYSLSLKERCSKTPSSLHNNHHLEKSNIPCSGLLTTINTPHLTLRFSHRKLTKTTKLKLRHIISHIIVPQPTILNLLQLHK